MDTLFPLGFPDPTAFYLVLYAVTLAIHVVFMNYVLAGTGYVAVTFLLHRRQGAGGISGDGLSAVLRDWLPFMLGAAITAGVAPLLFVQILYQVNFYTANLLLFHRWMVVVPVLVLGFYLLYLLKTAKLSRAAGGATRLIGLGAFLCFVFTALSWAENHLLSLREGAWPERYAAETLVDVDAALVVRLAVWVFGAFPTMAAVAGWQLRGLRPPGAAGDLDASRRLAGLALGGLVISVVAGAAYYVTIGPDQRSVVAGPLSGPYLGLAVGGILTQGVVWGAEMHAPGLARVRLWLASIGVAAMVVGTTVVREALRLSAVDLTGLIPHHARAAGVAGLPVFVVFLLANGVLVAWCIRLVRRRTLKAPAR
jgi:hypothetical protein